MGFARPEFTTLQARSAGEIDQLLCWTDISAPAGPSSNPSPSPSASQSPQYKSSANSEKSATIGDKKSSDPKPLIVLDGVLIQPNVVADLNFRTATEDDFAKVLNLSPSDIKDISVLKGEAAVSLYGENGRNGVIVITTKAQSAPVVENFQVSGQVLNASGNSPVVGANISEINTDNRYISGTVTDIDGRFTLNVKRSDNKLRVSHVSCESVIVPIQKDMTVTLNQKKLMLDETVVKTIQKTESSPVTDAHQIKPVNAVDRVVESLQVSGQVVNASSKSPLVGANIAEINTEGRTISVTITGIGGRFSLKVNRSDNYLKVSYVNCESVKVPIQKVMIVALNQKKILLDETVVKGNQKTESSPVTDAPQIKPVYGVEQMPSYPGAEEALKKYIKDNLRYPSAASNKGIQGKVICSFIVDATGKVTDVKVMSGVDPALDAEAVRVVSGMPTWIPGKQNGKDCAVQYALPILFSIQKK